MRYDVRIWYRRGDRKEVLVTEFTVDGATAHVSAECAINELRRDGGAVTVTKVKVAREGRLDAPDTRERDE